MLPYGTCLCLNYFLKLANYLEKNHRQIVLSFNCSKYSKTMKMNDTCANICEISAVFYSSGRRQLDKLSNGNSSK